MDYATRGTTADHSPSTHGVWHVEALLSWLDYCEQVIGSAHEVHVRSPAPAYPASFSVLTRCLSFPQTLAKSVCDAVQELFLTASLLPKLAKSYVCDHPLDSLSHSSSSLLSHSSSSLLSHSSSSLLSLSSSSLLSLSSSSLLSHFLGMKKTFC